jgi:thiol-disulfide isomerase/thioredoxin
MLAGCGESPPAAWDRLSREFWEAHPEYRAGHTADSAKWEEALRRCTDAEEFAVRALRLAKAHPKTELTGVELWWIITYFSEGPSCREAVEIYARDYRDLFAHRCRSLVWDRNAFNDPALAAMFRWGPDRQTRGRALLARARFRRATMHDSKTAQRLFHSVISDYGDLKISQDSVANLGDLARGELLKLESPNQVKEGWRAGERIPVFEARTTEGIAVEVPGSYKGKVLLIDFWATWCDPCVKEVPNLSAVYEQYHSDGLEILGVSLDRANATDLLDRFTRSHHMPWREVYDGKYVDSPIATLLGVTGGQHPTGIPHAFIVDGDTGVIIAEGPKARGPELATTIQRALASRKAGSK